jgi:hypothetical protein
MIRPKRTAGTITTADVAKMEELECPDIELVSH